VPSRDVKDTQVRGLYKRIGKTKTSWLLKKRIRGGKVKSISFADASIISVTEARLKAREILVELDRGVDPVAQARTQSAQSMTLGTAVDKYLSQRRGTLKASTIADYRKVLPRNLGSWMQRQFADISRDEIIDKYYDIMDAVAKRARVKKAGVNPAGRAEADKTMRYLSAVYGHFVDDPLPDNSGLILPYGNPVTALKTKKIKQEVKGRTTHLDLHERLALRDFLIDPSHYRNDDGSPRQGNRKSKVKAAQADWLLLLMLTGLRFNEPLQLKWSSVDFNERTFTITENKSKRPLTLPMSPMIHAIFERRQKATASISEYVFPQATNPNKPATMAKVVERVRELSGVEFIVHDLRRTQATQLTTLGYQLSDIGRILNHSRLNQTDEYIQTDIERIREAFERVEHMLFEIDIPPADEPSGPNTFNELSNLEPL